MLDNGFFLKRFELLNWGNFGGYQKFSLRGQGLGGLFAEPSSSAILGVNGSGKSTLIDGFMIALLPFEKSLKLGVTNDVETGGSGGRSIKDYVLGKYASTGSRLDIQHDEVFARKTGCSALLLSFAHGSGSDKQLTLGRLWWYRDGRVLDNSLFFISHKDISIESFCPEGQVPISAKNFKEHAEKNLPGLDIFEMAEAYYNSLSACLGGVKREDLKLLNRAFYVKSISNIDQFIRENMLVENESPHLDILLQNVRNGQEISQTIKTCEDKLELIDSVLKSLRKMQEVSSQRETLRRDSEILSLYPDWVLYENSRKELHEVQGALKELEIRVPSLKNKAEELEQRFLYSQSLLNKNESFQGLQILRERIVNLENQVEGLIRRKTEVEGVLRDLKLKIPKKAEDLVKLKEELEGKTEDLHKEKELLRQDTQDLLLKKEAARAQAEELKSEVLHLQNNQSLIPKSLYDIKLRACAELKIPKSHLMFVGEVLQVSKEFEIYRRAIESVLDPISKNLLCHPEALDKFTKWLNSQKVPANVVVKRIDSAELIRTRAPAFGNKSILKYIDVQSETENIFFGYMWNWLQDVFDYQIVEVADFRKGQGKLVTLEGLVKTDGRTMKKLKGDARNVLGWNPAERIEEIIAELSRLNMAHSGYEKELKGLADASDLNQQHLHKLKNLNQEDTFAYLMIVQMNEQIATLEKDQEQLLSRSRDLEKIQDEVEQLKALWSESVNVFHAAKVEWESQRVRQDILLNSLPGLELKLKGSILWTALINYIGGEEKLFERLSNTQSQIAKGKSYGELQRDMNAKIEKLSEQREGAAKTATGTLERYRTQFADPNLSYRIPDGDLKSFLSEWDGMYQYLQATELMSAKEKFREFFDHILLDSVKDTINEFKSQVQDIQKNIISINDVLKLVNYEDLPTEKRYLQIVNGMSPDERVLRFRKKLATIESTLMPALRAQAESVSQEVMQPLMSFVEDLQKDSSERYFVTDVRNHFYFQVHSYQRMTDGPDVKKEEFTGARKDAKSSAQTTQLAYTLLASSLAYRFKFNDPVAGKNTLRCLILDEFGGKFDNEKPKDIVVLLEKMGFQPLLVSPMSKADLLADRLSHLVMVHKVSAKESKVCSYPIMNREEYERTLKLLSENVAPV